MAPISINSGPKPAAINAIEVKTLGKIEQKKAKIISGFFVFKNKEIYNKYYQKMVNDKKEINGEYYIDTLCKVAIENGSKVLGLLIDKGRSYGTPYELKNLS